MHAPDPLAEFNWTPQPAAAAVVGGLLQGFLGQNAAARRFAQELESRAGVRFLDLVDHVRVNDPAIAAQLAAAGFVPRGPAHDGEGEVRLWEQPAGLFPTIATAESGPMRIAMKVEFIADFLAARSAAFAGLSARETPGKVHGHPLAPVRLSLISSEGGAEWWAVERHGSRSLRTVEGPSAKAMLHHAEAFRVRRRSFADSEQGFAEANRLVDAAIADVGADGACDLFFSAEREFWQRRNRAAQAQKARQDAMGIGWANHDHHTYRSSRGHFAALIALWEKLGLVCRERYHAGAAAGWGAQIMEHPATGIITFNDVDLSPEELFNDFSHEGLVPRESLGTVGLWCALHGEALLEAGMHHLECQFDFDRLKLHLENDDQIKVMNPFTDFPHLRQAFTEGERWPVAPARISALLSLGRITQAQADGFLANGAIGSHLENLERNDGFKGFNQKGVSEIIARTDPRLHSHG